MGNNPNFLGEDRGIILAADVSHINDLRKLAELGSQVGGVVAIKVGFSLALRYGLPPLVKAVKEVTGLPVIYDHQKAGTDIPAMGKPFAEVCLDAGIQGIILFPHAGPKTLESFIKATFDCKLTPIVGLVMSHEAYLAGEGGFIIDDAPEIICRIALSAGVRNFVLPGTKPDIIAKYCQGSLSAAKPANIMMPGFGSQGGLIARAFEASRGHFQFPIIGSAIYKSANPMAALEQFVAEIRA